MKVLGIRFCSVSDQARLLSDFLEKGLGVVKKDMGSGGDELCGSVFPAGESSRIEVWQEAEGMPAGIMLQIIVDNADEMAATARENGIKVQGPSDMFGERIYFATAPTGLPVSFQSKIEKNI